MSMYREEAMDVLISCLGDSDFPTAQISAAETIISLQGRFSTSGRPLGRYSLLERAGLTKGHRKLIRRDNINSALGEVELTRVSLLEILDIFSMLESLQLACDSYYVIQKIILFS